MNQLLNIIQDENGQTSSMRVGKLIILAVWVFQCVMHILNPSEAPEPSIAMTATVLGAFGIGTLHKNVEKKKNNKP